MLNIYTVFHGNLQFSSIPKNQYKNVIEKCYWPLIKLLENNGKLKLGIEFSGLSLLEVRRLEPKLIEKIKILISQKKLEFIGSSYTQAIFPLIPYEINLKNLELGIKIYKEILGEIPRIFYVNEQTFSDGLISIYNKTGIENIVVDFDSTKDDVRSNKILLYNPIMVKSQREDKINVIWNSSIAFQKMQRYVFDEISFEDYYDYLSIHLSSNKNGSFCLYGGDWEVFGFSPKGIERNCKNDYKRMAELFDRLSKVKAINFILPCQLIEKGILSPQIRLTDFQDPIVCKKQEKYNVSRWALAGKNTIFRNTQCFRLFKAIEEFKKSKRVDNLTVNKLEKNIVRLWGSDYRTNTTEDKNSEYDKFLLETQKVISKYLKKEHSFSIKRSVYRENKSKSRLITEDGCIETDSVKLTLDRRKGATIKELLFPKIFPKKIAGLTAHGYFQNQQLSSDWFSGHCLFETDSGNKYTDLYPAQIFVKKNHNGEINLFSEIKTPIGTIKKKYKVYQNLPRVDLQYVFNLKKVGLKSARIGNVTLDPLNFDKRNLWYATVNGGKSKELFKIGNNFVAQDELVSLRISSRGCLGATDGWIAVGDNKKGLAIIWDKTQLASCPIIHFENTPEGLFSRIQQSVAESDETGFPIFESSCSFSMSLLAYNTESTDVQNVIRNIEFDSSVKDAYK